MLELSPNGKTELLNFGHSLIFNQNLTQSYVSLHNWIHAKDKTDEWTQHGEACVVDGRSLKENSIQLLKWSLWFGLVFIRLPADQTSSSCFSLLLQLMNYLNINEYLL